MDGTSGGGLVSDVHPNGGDIDSLLSSDADKKPRRLHEPYERHRAHDLRAECYRRGLRPIKKGPHANDNKGGYIELLRRNDGSTGPALNSTNPVNINNGALPSLLRESQSDQSVGNATENDVQIMVNNKRKLPTMTMQTQTQTDSNGSGELQGFYEGGQPTLVPVLPMQYPSNPNLNKASANPTTDLEILSGIANSYTQNAAADGQLCGNCRTVVTDQLMESIRLGKTKMQLQEWHKLTEQRDRDTNHLKDVLDILQGLRRSYREAQQSGMGHDLLVELQDDMAFFRTLKEQTKERMRQAMRDARERSTNKPNASA
ncbi:hypothetical protein PHYSODRAFT_471018 [Phytophthora sojae]|uniref:Uncharacterized protein n=1 Tax=Phytophthora sojae (strain P6497) TaxID=1094619 RepID=G4YEF5_PHYSP|nr:hypothetical protein PHYSODRAFT_471018 [Phytophthora sojae]EGZ26862.1 hypothetical protein PHYSODRAFT_471018 [Phytophthora sojae]|eukprot:XP_009514137.1 hypothetical protein PHYSODRAFT_471018 [Phytophthora sojae]